MLRSGLDFYIAVIVRWRSFPAQHGYADPLRNAANATCTHVAVQGIHVRTTHSANSRVTVSDE